jgi:diadenosine tetraphosphate (Ap4A) HIT family hydrolase
VLKLSENWTLNHYGGPEGFLGWLALQPARHIVTLGGLTPAEYNELGSQVFRIDAAMVEHWPTAFGDVISRLYVAYFYESPYLDPHDEFHLHIHLIPRFASLPKTMFAWNIHRAAAQDDFPNQYRRSDPDFASKAAVLIRRLGTALSAEVIEPHGHSA